MTEQQLRTILASTLELVRDQQARLFELGWEIAALREVVCETQPEADEFLTGALAKHRSRDLDTYNAFLKRISELAGQLVEA